MDDDEEQPDSSKVGEIEFARIAKEYGVQIKPQSYQNFVDDIISIVQLGDVEVDDDGHSYMGSFLGLCSSGVCLLRLSVVLHNHFGSSQKLQTMLKAPEVKEVLELYRSILMTVIQCGKDGVRTISVLASNEEDLRVICDLMRSELDHPTRHRISELETFGKGGKNSALRDAFKKGFAHIFNDALDSLLCLLIVQDAMQGGLDRSDPGFVAVPGDSPVLRAECLRAVPPEIELDEPPAAPDPPADVGADLVRRMSQSLRYVLWETMQLEDGDQFHNSEKREIIRMIVTRPVLGLLVRSRILIGAPQAPPPDRRGGRDLEQPTADVRSLAGLRCVHASVEGVATELHDVAEDFWRTLTRDGDEAVGAADFEANIAPAVQVVVKRVADKAGKENLFWPRIFEIQDAVREKEGRGNHSEAQRAAQKRAARSHATASATEEVDSVDGTLLSDDNIVEYQKPPARSVCNMEWLTDWMSGRKCIG